MHRTARLLAALATLSAALAMPLAAASPCATACGSVQTVLNCVTVTVTAEGTSAQTGTEWRFVVHESWNYGGGRTHEQTKTGAAVTFEYANTVPPHWIYNVDSYLYANGERVAEDHWGCYSG